MEPADCFLTKLPGKGFCELLREARRSREHEKLVGLFAPVALSQEVQEQVEDAIKRGAKVLAGGKQVSGFKTTNFYEPTLLVDAPHDSRVVQEEVFGPALPIFRVKDLDEAIKLANSSIYGLGSSIWTKDLARANKAANKIQAGVTWINSLHYGYDELPFGGVKMSGIGREHGPEALDYYFEPKGVVYAGLA